MSRMIYNTATPFGQMISEGIDYIQVAALNIERTSKAINEMNAEQCEAELGVEQNDFANFRNRLKDIKSHLEDDKFRSLLVMFDQG